MKKQAFFLLLLVTAVFLSLIGCASNVSAFSENFSENTAYNAETPNDSDEVSSKEYIDEGYGRAPGMNPSKKLKQYLDLYCPVSIYQDYYIDNQYLFVTKNQVIMLFLSGEFSTCTVIDISEIVCAEASTIDDISFLKIVDKSNRTHELALSSECIGSVIDEISTLQNGQQRANEQNG